MSCNTPSWLLHLCLHVCLSNIKNPSVTSDAIMIWSQTWATKLHNLLLIGPLNAKQILWWTLLMIIQGERGATSSRKSRRTRTTSSTEAGIAKKAEKADTIRAQLTRLNEKGHCTETSWDRLIGESGCCSSSEKKRKCHQFGGGRGCKIFFYVIARFLQYIPRVL